MNRWAISVFAFVGCSIGLLAGPVQAIAPDPVTDRYRPIAEENQRLAGVIAMRLRANSEGFLESYRPDKTNASSDGLFLSAASRAYEYHQDVKLRSLMDAALDRLSKSIPTDGASPRSLHLVGDELKGVLDFYTATGEESAYTLAQQTGDSLTKKFSNTGAADAVDGTYLVEPLVSLYRYTAEPSYLALAKKFAADHSASSETTDEGRLSTAAAAAELYRATGDTALLERAVETWRSFRHANPSFTLKVAFEPVGTQRLTANWISLTLKLLRISGQPQYAQALEETIYNELFAAQNPRNGWLTPSLLLRSERKQFLPITDIANAPTNFAVAEALARVPEIVWGRFGNGIAVNLYTGGRASVQLRRRALIQLYSEATFPQRGEVLLHVDPSHAAHFPLRLRVPEWSKGFTADIDGTHLMGRPGEYLVIDREWHRGDAVKINTGLRTIITEDEDLISVQRGPQILVVGRSLNKTLSDLIAVGLNLSAVSSNVDLKHVDDKFPADWAGDQAYEASGEVNGQPKQIILIPLADALDYSLFFRRGNVKGSSDQSANKQSS